MRKLLLPIASLLALGSSQGIAGPTVHKEVLGSWCSHGMEEGDKEGHYGEQFPDSKECGDGIMTIKPDRYQGWEHGCRYTAVKTWFDPNIVASTKTMGVKVSRIEARCEGEGCTWMERLTVHVTKGTLVVKDARHYRERCR